jgi:glycosyltransferase involved in cell wall biosynthesis
MKQKLLVLTPRFPLPPIGGDRLRIYQVCKQLSAVCDLTLLSLCATRDEMHAPVDAGGVFTSVHRVYHPRWKSACGALSVLPSRTPLQVGYYRNREFSWQLRELAPRHDGILAHLIRTGDYIRDLPMPKFLEMTDAISLAYNRISKIRLGNIFQSLLYRIEASRLKNYEVEIMRSFDLTVLVSAIDRDFLDRGAVADDILVCPIGVELKSFPFNYSPDSRTIVFIGNLTSHQNLDAASFFAGAILPLIRERIPDARFKVVGRIEPRARQALERHAGVMVTGAVDSVPAAVRGASAGVCPIRFGAGMQTKLLEYMALGIPAVTSPIGLEGLRATPNRHILLAASPQQWVDHICCLLKDRERGRTMACAARALVEQHYSWTATLAPLCAAVESRLEGRTHVLPKLEPDCAGAARRLRGDWEASQPAELRRRLNGAETNTQDYF